MKECIKKLNCKTNIIGSEKVIPNFKILVNKPIQYVQN